MQTTDQLTAARVRRALQRRIYNFYYGVGQNVVTPTLRLLIKVVFNNELYIGYIINKLFWYVLQKNWYDIVGFYFLLI